ncbi:hypothetical protein [Bradyrhizobium sp. Ash2021]|uniref:hypothetical protein n=1 Tax=Bradyrhizobium sp. Ash2021 TaxID=2954771 RepID=UPI0028167C8E|nr:hypothetical protein [Bradyrhizobium sp. Ash2021]WMT73407.1 hypothetical protein NL528_36475 [Bradyrhizobium sp. Ash2021]
MLPYLKAILLLALVSGVAFVASSVLVPDVVPIADTDQPQPYLQLAFVLKAIELTGLGGAVLVLISALQLWLGKQSETTTVR